MRISRILANLALSLGTTLLVVALLLQLKGGIVDPARVLRGVRQAIPALVGAYIACQLAQTLLRAHRSHILLADSTPTRIPSLPHLTLVTFVRNACADTLPARLGELSYVAMLNRGYSVPAADCLSSLSIGLLFDFIALLFVLAIAAPTAANGLSLLGSLILLAAVCILGWTALFHLLPRLARAAQRLRTIRLFRARPFAPLLTLFLDSAAAIHSVRHAGSLTPIILTSLSIRAAKYAGLYCLYLAVTQPLYPALANASIFTVLTALIAAEGTAALPVPTFLSFGSYEAGGLAALTALGLPTDESFAAMFAIHILSQIVDYSLGALAYLAFTWLPKSTTTASAPDPASAPSPTPFPWLRLLLSSLFLAASILFLALQVRAITKRGRLTAPPSGFSLSIPPDEAAARSAALARFSGRIVWSSNRSGLHSLYQLTLPDATLQRLTDSGFTDTYPRYSPDGTLIAFSRSTQPWVSLRDGTHWDTWVLDPARNTQWRVATNAFMAVWSPDGSSLIFQRDNGASLVQAPLHPSPDSPEKILLQSGSGSIPKGTLLTLPAVRDADPWLAITLRGSTRATAHVYRDGRLQHIASGCQMIWRGPSHLNQYAWIDHPGNQQNAIYSGPPNAPLFDAPPSSYSHEYFPAFDASGKILVYAASTGAHEQDSEDYEIFLLDTSTTSPIRISYHSGNDTCPDIFLTPHTFLPSP